MSVSYAAVELAKKVFGKLKGKQAIIIGREMSELSLLNLLGSGIDDITVVNRTETNAYKLATKHGVNYNTLESLPTLLTNADIVISSTSSPDFIVTKSMIESILREKLLHYC